MLHNEPWWYSAIPKFYFVWSELNVCYNYIASHLHIHDTHGDDDHIGIAWGSLMFGTMGHKLVIMTFMTSMTCMNNLMWWQWQCGASTAKFRSSKHNFTSKQIYMVKANKRKKRIQKWFPYTPEADHKRIRGLLLFHIVSTFPPIGKRKDWRNLQKYSNGKE